MRRKNVSEKETESIIKSKLKLKRGKLSRIKTKDKVTRVKTSVNTDVNFNIKSLFSKKQKIQTSTIKKIKESTSEIKTTLKINRMQLKINFIFFSLKTLSQTKITLQS